MTARQSAVTNRVFHAGIEPSFAGHTVNTAIPVAAIDAWKRRAFEKIVHCQQLPQNWDGRGTGPISRIVTQAAIEFVRNVPGDFYPVPIVGPVSGGGLHLEWLVGNRELEVSISPVGNVEALRVENGVPQEESGEGDLASLFSWLAGH